MEPDDYTIDITTTDLHTYTVDTVDLSSITLSADSSIDWSGIEIVDKKRTTLRDSGAIPVDIWAKIYNNGNIDD